MNKHYNTVYYLGDQYEPRNRRYCLYELVGDVFIINEVKYTQVTY
jgi:hypothetical protein